MGSTDENMGAANMELPAEKIDTGSQNAKLDSAYNSNSSNSQSRRSSKSTQSRSQSSSSSGYGGKPSTSGCSTDPPPEKRTKDKERKKKQHQQTESHPHTPIAEATDEPDTKLFHLSLPQVQETQKTLLTKQEPDNNGSAYFAHILTPQAEYTDQGPASMDLSTSVASSYQLDGYFTSVISLHDGVVMYATASMTNYLGFPLDMWVGRSFIKFLHPDDRETFATQIASGLATLKQEKAISPETGDPLPADITMVCRIRRYRSLVAHFTVKEYNIKYLPFLMKFTIKDVQHTEDGKITYLVIQAKPLISAFKEANELLPVAVPFVMRHAANGLLEYIDHESVPYLGYIPQDIMNTDVLKMYHTDDLIYLAQVYETIVQKGGVPRSRAYRLLAQNGDYLKVETEWTSFVNPWSKKLEFVTGKHHVIEGPTNPDVFEIPPPGEKSSISEEEANKSQGLRISILRIMNEVLIKSAEAAKRQMSRRCQDLASFMESLMEHHRKTDEAMSIAIHDNDDAYLDRDGITSRTASPNQPELVSDSKSSTETIFSYSHVNFNENLQRYFESQESFTNDVVVGQNALLPTSRHGVCRMSSIGKCYGESSEQSSDSSGMTIPSYSVIPFKRLTESILIKHNLTMNKEMVKTHREKRSIEGNKETSSDRRQKRKEHLARCNATYQPALSAAVTNQQCDEQPHGVKRGSKQAEKPKHHCSSPTRSSAPRKSPSPAPSMATAASTVGHSGSGWPSTPMGNINPFFMGIGVPPHHQMPVICPPAITMQGMFPMCYAPTTSPATPDNTTGRPETHFVPQPGVFPICYVPTTSPATPNNPTGRPETHFIPQAVHYTLYGHHGSMVMPVMPVDAHMMSYAVPQEAAKKEKKAQGASASTQPGGSKNIETRATSPSAPRTRGDTKPAKEWSEKREHVETRVTCTTITRSSSCASAALNRSLEPAVYSLPDRGERRQADEARNTDEPSDRTDGGSSYSSFYSSFFKTDCGSSSNTDSAEGKRLPFKTPGQNIGREEKADETKPAEQKFACKSGNARKSEAPWMENVNVPSELMYNYQVRTKTLEEILEADKQKIVKFEQPGLVNDQLNDLYMELHLNGRPQMLSLEAGMTSSGSSSEESLSSAAPNKVHTVRRKREHSKLVMIYEEDAPFPPSPTEGALLAPIDSPSNDNDATDL